MRFAYSIMLWLSERELQIALSAPVVNPKNIKQIEGDVARWNEAIWYIDHPLLP